MEAFAKFGNGRLTGASFTAGMHPANKPKNRFANVLILRFHLSLLFDLLVMVL
jgi:hypothetical protein